MMQAISRRRAEMGEGIVALALSAALYAVSFTFAPPLVETGMAIGPLSIPRAVLVLVGLMGIGRILIASRAPRGETVQFPVDPVVLGTAALAIAYALAAVPLGLVIPMPVFCAGLAWMWGGRHPGRLIAMALGAPIFVWLLFDLMFRAQLPLFPAV